MKKYNEQEMISLLKEKWPKLNLALMSEFTGNKEDRGIWFKSSLIEVIIDEEVFEIPIIGDMYQTYDKLEQFLDTYNWMSEPHDSETLMAYPNY